MYKDFNVMLNELIIMPNGMYSIEKENGSLDIWLYPDYIRFEWRDDKDFCIYDSEISNTDDGKLFEIIEYCCTKGGVTLKDFESQIIESRIMNFINSIDKKLIEYLTDENYE